MIAEQFPRRQLTTAVSIFAMAPKLGPALGFAVGGLAVAVAADLARTMMPDNQSGAWRLVMMFAGAPAVLLSFLVLTLPEKKRLPPSGTSAASMRELLSFLNSRRGFFVPMIAAFSLVAIVGQSLLGWTATYLSRTFDWHAGQYGPTLGLISLLGGLTLVFKGVVIDFFYARGVKDIQLRFYAWLLAVCYPAMVSVFLFPSPVVFIALYAITSIVAMPFVTYMVSSAQAVTPNHMRGRVAALVSIAPVIVGGLGPLIVGTITDVVFRDESRVGLSLAIVIGISIPLAVLCLCIALRPLRSAIQRAEVSEQ